jgi:hypothetical protein
MKKIKVKIEEAPVYDNCEYCLGKGFKEYSFYEEFLKEETKMTYLCPSCKGIKKKEVSKQKLYSKNEVNYIGRISLCINNEIVELDVESTSDEYLPSPFSDEFYGSITIGSSDFYNLEKVCENPNYFYFDTDEDANAFIETLKGENSPK